MLRYLAWSAVGVFFMIGTIAPVGKVLWIAAAALVALLLALGVRSPRYLFAVVAGIGATLVGLAFVNTTYILMVLYGGVLICGGIVGFAAFGPRTSKADGPETFPEV